MKKNDKNINDYFNKAREQEVPFSKDDARNLIEKHSQLVPDKYFRKFKGVNKMTIISASIAGLAIFGFLTFNSIDNVESENQNSSRISNINTGINEVLTQGKESDDKVSHEQDTKSGINNDLTSNSEFQKESNKESIAVASGSYIGDKPLDTKGIDYIILNKEQFEKLGIKIRSDEEFEFHIPSELMNIKYKINLNKGMEFEEIYDTEYSQIKSPIFISRENGEKIFGRFTSDDNSMQMVYSKFIHYDTNEIQKDFDMNITQMIEEYPDGKVKEIYADSIKFRKKINVIIDKKEDLENSEQNNVIARVIREEMRDSLLNPENSEILIRKVFERINSDSNLKSMAYNNDKFNFDIDVMKDTSDESIFINLNDIENVRVNKLLPVAYESKDEIKCIFWFDPDLELIKMLPEKYHEQLIAQYELIENNNYCEPVKAGEETYFDILQSCSGGLKNLNAYPNPTDGALNVNFILEESCKVNLSLHEVSGEKIKNLIANKQYNAGNIEEFFDISDLPSGMYVIIITNDKGDQVLQRIIKR